MKPLPPDPESLRPGILRSAVVHGIVLLGVAGYSYLQGKITPFGDPNPLTGGSVIGQRLYGTPVNPVGYL